QQQQNTKKNQNLVDDNTAQQPPKAKDDQLRARPGVVSTLHVLDNDSDTTGNILAIAPGDVTSPDVSGVTAQVAADGQAILLTVPRDVTGDRITFSYTVNNGGATATSRATAKVSVQLVGDDVNTAPVLRLGGATLGKAKFPALPRSNVALAVLADWRDGESDPVTADATTAGTSIDGQGRLSFRAPDETGSHQVAFAVDDGHGLSAKASVTVDVLADTDRPAAPRTQTDVVRGVVGKPVQVEPLGNDITGADPTDPEATLRVASAVRPVGDLQVDTNTDTGVVTVTGTTPGTYVLSYAAQVGSATDVGRIRVDVLADPDQDAPPVAATDAATLRDQLATISDVLANDYSPRGDVLVTQRVVSDAPWIRASVVQGRWLHLQATQPAVGGEPRHATVQYVVSDGVRQATGQVAVTQKPPLDQQVVPLVQDDEAVVRVGDSVSIPVQDNDSMADGVPLRLDPQGARVVTGKGSVFVSGNVLRFVPDDTPRTTDSVAVLEYTTFPDGLPENAVTGRVTVTVKPAPTPATPDQAPVPRSFSASVTAGDSINVTVPTSGVDPDGDSVTVTGIVGDDGDAVDLTLGRVVSVSATTLRYEAYPRSAGTETIRYQVRDRYGLLGEGFIRMGVVPPSDPQPPVAVEDEVVAAPGRTVNAPVLDNDLVSPHDEVTLEDVAKLNDPAVAKRFSHQRDDTYRTVVPEEGSPSALTYGLDDGLFDPSRTTLLVRGQKDFVNPPVAVDDVAKPKDLETSTLVDALANDYDLDGDNASLKLVEVLGEGATIEGRKVRVTVEDHPRSVPYVIEDADGARAMALIYVPAGGDGSPFVVSGALIQMDPNSTQHVDLADYVRAPSGSSISITSPDTLSTSPVDALQGQATSGTGVDLTSMRGYVGPGALMVEVTDASSPGQQDARTSYVSVPVQIGPKQPVLRCPAYTVTVIARGPARTVDVPRLCHAWLPQGLDLDDVRFTARWKTAPQKVDLRQTGQGGRAVVLHAQDDAPDGQNAVLRVGVEGAAEQFDIGVRVIGIGPDGQISASVPPPSLRPVQLGAIEPGASRTVDLRPYLSSPLVDAGCTITGSKPLQGNGISGSGSGCKLTVRAGDRASGAQQLLVTVSDAPGREAVGRVSVSVRGKPLAPQSVSAVADRVQGGSARVSWQPPAFDGGLPVQQYEVRWSGGAKSCTASPCTITGLKNGTAYRFTVRARNAAGWSPDGGPSRAVTPDTAPPPISGVSVTSTGDRTLGIRWDRPSFDGTAVDTYEVQYTNVGGHPGSRTLRVSATSARLQGLENDDQYSIRVRGHNKAGWGKFGPAVRGQSVGTPPAVAAPTLEPRTPGAGDDNGQVKITWQPTDPNGPPLTHYTVYYRVDGGGWQSLGNVSAGATRVKTHTIPYDGRTYGYTVTATNGGGKESARSNVSNYRSVGIPSTPGTPKVTTPSSNTQATATFRLGTTRASRFTQVKWELDNGRTGAWSCSSNCPENTSVSRQLAGLSVDNQHRVRVSTCNDAGQCSTWSAFSNAFQPYGPPKKPVSQGSSANARTITYRWSQDTNGRPINGFQVRSQGTTHDLGGGARSWDHTYNQWDTAFSITVRAKDSTGAWSAWTTINGRTDKEPVPDKKITNVHAGAKTGDCGNCYKVLWHAQGVTPGGYTLKCFRSGRSSAFYTGNVTVLAGGGNSGDWCSLDPNLGPKVNVQISGGPSGTVQSGFVDWYP
ncbi:fibronectin type III domain-containing protein, partial [Angustibacter peucedani]